MSAAPLLSVLILPLLATAVAAEPMPLPPTAKPAAGSTAQSTSPRPLRQPKTDPCAAFGPGFVRMAGSDTCVRVGGGIGIGVGGSSR